MSFSANFFLGSIDVNQNVNLFDKLPEITEAFPDCHYNLTVSVNFLQLLQPSGNYIQNATNVNDVDINLNFDCNSDLLNVYLGQNNVYNTTTGAEIANAVQVLSQGTGVVGGVSRKGLVTGVNSPDSNLGFRFLEVAALQIFGHAKARAAIRNDTEFSVAMNDATSKIDTLVAGYTESDSVKREIFNYYIRQNLLDDANVNGDVTSPVNFNFAAFNFQGFRAAVRINFNMPTILDSVGSAADRTVLGIADDPAVNILLLLTQSVPV
jgi:hypothetical protein